MTADPFDLTGRVAIVTGAGSGIGRASAALLASRGATVVGADVTGDPPVDVSRKEDVDALVDRTVADHGRLDVMANVAGVMLDSSVADLTEPDLDRIIGVNLKGVLFGCQAAARVMVEQGSGSIVNMASGAIDTPAPNIAAYAMTKAAVAQLTKSLAVEIGARGVRVNAIAPGYVLTWMTARRFTKPDGTVDEAMKEAVAGHMAQMAPLGRVGDPIDIAYAVLYLASDASSFMTGQILRPNGGIAMP